MPLFRLFTALTSMGALSSAVYAGSVTGRIELIQAGLGYTPQNAYALVKVNGTPDNQPGCATDARFALNPATEAGKAFLALLMSAKAAGNSVTLVGTGACDVMGGEFESISHLQVYFTLNGVAVADPVVPSSPWFAISRTQEGAKEAFAMLLAARASGSLLRVVTNGALACGYPAVQTVVLRP